jgi:hypothetical protein
MVLVVGVTVDWAFAEKVANGMKTARQNKTAAEFSLKAGLLRANDARIRKGLTFWPSCPGTLAPGIITDIQEGIIQTAGPPYLQRDLHPEALLNCASQTREQSTALEIYLHRFTSRFWRRKSGSMSRPADL